MSKTVFRPVNEFIWICPVCRMSLTAVNRTFQCINGHCYDISSDGYVNLLLANRKHSHSPGDSREMLDARRKFLNAGYYSPLSDRIRAIIKRHLQEKKIRPCVILDAGCGEGHYLDLISGDDVIGNDCRLYGIDISKYGIWAASKKNRGIVYAVASIYDLPVENKSVDVLISIFSPFDEPGFIRALSDEGIIISVTPGARHLEGLKKILYEDPHLHDEKITAPEGLIQSQIERISYEIEVNNAEDISCLLKMTPYYHKTGKDKISGAMESLNKLKTEVDFLIRLFVKSV